MISLIKAIRLCRIREDEFIYLKERGKDNFMCPCFSLREIRQKFDMRAIKVYAISPKFERFGDGFLGMEFKINRLMHNRRG